MNFTVKILGTGSATPLKGRHHSAQLLTIDQGCYLIDCGEGTQYRLIESKVNLNKIEVIFISHLHGDHFFGLVGLISTMSLLGRKHPLKIFAPPGLHEIIVASFKVSGTVLELPITLNELRGEDKQIIFEDNYLTASSFPLKHGIPTFGFLLEEKPRPRKLVKEKIPAEMKVEEMVLLKNGFNVYHEDGNVKYSVDEHTHPPSPCRRYAYCSDTVYSEEIVPFVKNVDLLYHEATYLEEHKDRAKRNHHATAKEAASIAQKAEAKGLMIGHLSSRYEDFETHLKEAQEIFPNTVAAIEGKTISLI